MTTGIAAPGTVASAARAEAFALAWLSRHLPVLAPGSSITDFVVVANDLSSGIRTVGLQQHHHGVPVIGGQLGVRFKADRLVLVSSQALPHVSTALAGPSAPPTIDEPLAVAEARAWIARDFLDLTRTSAVSLTVTAPEGPFVLPIWTGTAWAYHEVVRVTVRSPAPLGAWVVYLDAHTAAPVAREQRMRSAATVRFDAPVRHPGAARQEALARQLGVVESGLGATTDLDGEVA